MSKSIPQKLIPWVEAKKRHRLTDVQVQMARELGMNPKKLGKIDNCQATLKGTPLRAVPIPTPCMRSYYRFSPPLWLSVFRRLSGPASRSGRSRSVFGNLERINPLLRFSRNRKLSPVIKRVWL